MAVYLSSPHRCKVCGGFVYTISGEGVLDCGHNAGIEPVDLGEVVFLVILVVLLVLVEMLA